jgi:hypothetical protein
MLSTNIPKSIEIKGNFNIPTFNYVQDRWATTREKNVIEISEAWSQDPNRVLVLTDPKFGENSMVILKKDLFETVLKLLMDVLSGEVQIQTDVQTLLDAITILKSRVAEQGLDTKDLILGNAIQIISRLQGKVTSSLNFIAPTRPIEPPSLSEEEIMNAKNLPEDEEEK